MKKNWTSDAFRVCARGFSVVRSALQRVAALARAARLRWASRLKVRSSREVLVAFVPEPNGGAVHVIPRIDRYTGHSRSFQVFEVEDAEMPFDVWMVPQRVPGEDGPGWVHIGSWRSAEEAQRAVRTIGAGLCASVFWRWSFRLGLAGLAWLLISSYLEVRSGAMPGVPGGLAQGPTSLGGPEALVQIPLGPSPFVPAPGLDAPRGDVAAHIRNEAALAQRLAEKDSMPPKTGSTDGLEGFGLKIDRGPGCDPKLAFKAPR